MTNERIQRRSFEKWIGGPPYERDLERWPMDESKHAWPGQYKDIAVQLAWEAWQEAQQISPVTNRANDRGAKAKQSRTRGRSESTALPGGVRTARGNLQKTKTQQTK